MIINRRSLSLSDLEIMYRVADFDFSGSRFFVDRSETKVECSVAGIAHQIRCPVTPTSPRRIFVSMEMHGRPRIYLLRIVRQYRHESERARARERSLIRRHGRAFLPPSPRIYILPRNRAPRVALGWLGPTRKKKERERGRERGRKKYIKICGSKRKTGYDPGGRLL